MQCVGGGTGVLRVPHESPAHDRERKSPGHTPHGSTYTVLTE